MRRFTFIASFLAAFAFSSFGPLHAHGPGGGHGGGGHGGGGQGNGHGGAQAGGKHGGDEHGGDEHGRSNFAGVPGGGGNTITNGLGASQTAGPPFLGGTNGLMNAAVASKLAGSQMPPIAGNMAGLNGANPLGNALAAGNGLTGGRLNNGAGLGGLINGLNPQQKQQFKAQEQLLHKRLIEAHKLQQLAKQSGDPKLLAQAQQMAQQAETQFAKEVGQFPGGGLNQPGVTISKANAAGPNAGVK